MRESTMGSRRGGLNRAKKEIDSLQEAKLSIGFLTRYALYETYPVRCAKASYCLVLGFLLTHLAELVAVKGTSFSARHLIQR